jgi:glycosyltransferase involved in cell wall biosynthesis
MKEVFIISTMQLFKGKTAGSQRILNIAKSLALGDTKVFLCSLTQISNGSFELSEFYPNIYHLESRKKEGEGFLHLLHFLFSLNRFIKDRKSESVIYLYPTPRIFHDFIYLVYFKIIKKHRFYCEINELRVTNLFTLSVPKNLLLRSYFYLKLAFYFVIFKLNELQVSFYDGIIVISRNLEEYFSGFSKKIIRVPILCDLSGINFENLLSSYNTGVFKICFSGSITVRKEGFDLLFEALSLINHKKNVELYLYGNIGDNDNFELNALIEKFKIRNKVFYQGHIAPDKLSQEFCKYNLLILPRPLNNQTKYGFSTKLSEYLVSGVPVLVTDVSDNSFYIKDGYNGFIIAPGSLSEMVFKIFDIIDNYNKYFYIVTNNAYKTAQENFDYKLFTSKIIKFFFKE